jgi:Heterokaryon incompatibility protein Het-C
VELALIELGYLQVFPHVGSNTQIQILGSNKSVWPLVTGTFGGVDFIHSLLGEATDRISQTQISDLNAAITDAEHQNTQAMFDKLKILVKLVPSGQADLDSIQQNGQTLARQGHNFHLQGTQGDGPAVTAEEIANMIYPIVSIRDRLLKTVTSLIDKVS